MFHSRDFKEISISEIEIYYDILAIGDKILVKNIKVKECNINQYSFHLK